MNDKVVYLHRKKDSDTIFYVGIGSKQRSKSKLDRNPHWHNVVNKYGYSIEIVAENLSWENACELECFLIGEIGRKDLGKGELVNMTDGGDGCTNWSKERTEKMININKNNMKSVSQYDKSGKLIATYRSISFASKELNISRQTIRDCCLGKGRTAGGYAWEYSYVKYKHNKERFDKGSQSMKGIGNPMSKVVLNTLTGIYYDSINCASKSQTVLNDRAFKAQLSGQNKNKTNFIVL